MSNQESNNEFFSYQGTISRKDYIINMLILIALYISISYTHFENFAQYINYEILYKILLRMVRLFKILILLSAISVIFRRIADFSVHKSYKFNDAMKKLFVFLYVFPMLYIYCIRYFFDIMPFLINILNLLVFIIIIPLAFITSIVLCFIKSK